MKAIGKTVMVGIAVIVILVVAAGAVAASMGTHTTNGSTQTASSSSHLTNSAVSSSSTLYSSGKGPLSITVTQAITDKPDASSGQSVYIYYVVIVDTDKTTHFVDPINFQLVGTSNSVYQFAVVTAMSQNSLQSVTLSPNQQASGQIAFQVNSGDTPAKLEYQWSLESVNVVVNGLPAPNATVSLIKFGSATVKGDSNLQAFVSVQNDSYPANQGYFWTGQVISLKIALTNFNVGMVQVTGLNDTDNGFKILGISPALPVSVGSSEVDLTVYLATPSTGFSGIPNIMVSASG